MVEAKWNGAVIARSDDTVVIAGREGIAMVNGVATSLGTEDCMIDVSVLRLGKHAPAAVDYGSQFNVRPVILLHVNDIKNADTSLNPTPQAFKAGGVDSRLRVSGSGVPGHLGNFVGGTASGVHRIDMAGVSGVHTGADPINCVVYTEGANTITALYLTGEVTGAPATLVIDIAGFGTKIRKRDLWLNGAEVLA